MRESLLLFYKGSGYLDRIRSKCRLERRHRRPSIPKWWCTKGRGRLIPNEMHLRSWLTIPYLDAIRRRSSNNTQVSPHPAALNSLFLALAIVREHSAMLSAQQAVAQSRKSRGFFSTLWNRRKEPAFKPTYNYQADGSACRIYGNLLVKKVTANLHITTLGHGYASYEHVDHTRECSPQQWRLAK